MQSSVFHCVYPQGKLSKHERGERLLPSEMQYAHIVVMQGGSEVFIVLSLEKE